MRRMMASLMIAAVLAGCVAPGQSASDRTRVMNGALTLAAPRGFCVDPKARRDAAEGSFVLWGNCAAIAGDPEAPKPPYRAMLSATVGPASSTPLATAFDGFESFFRSGAGRAALARSGQAKDVQVLKVERHGGMLLLKISDRSAATAAPVTRSYWRAITEVKGHVTALSVLPLEGSAMRDADQIALLQGFEASIRAAN